ncbi:LCP family protein [Phytohabitans suffuscus]|nr:LCP family protein [Phytohabitans suffuscus]
MGTLDGRLRRGAHDAQRHRHRGRPGGHRQRHLQHRDHQPARWRRRGGRPARRQQHQGRGQPAAGRHRRPSQGQLRDGRAGRHDRRAAHPPSHDQAYLVSLPRDWRVQIPAYPKTGFGGSTEKINSAFSYGYQGPGTELEKRARGVDSLAQTVHTLTGIKFNGAAIIDFAGFESVVKTLGGVNMCVDERAESIHLGIDKKGKIYKLWYKEGEGIQDLPPGAKAVVHEKGCRRMSAELALDYARIRKSLSDGDYGRQRHQQQLIKAIAKEATSKGVITNPLKLNNVIKAAGKAFVLDTQGIPVEDFIFTLRGVAAHDLVLIKTNAGKFNTQRVNGQEFEQLSEESLQMLGAVRDGRLAEFVISNPQFIAKT